MTHILITRPKGKGEALAKQLEQAGYQATLCPVLQLTYKTPSNSELTPLINADKIIFISQDAVNALVKLKPDINIKAQFYAVGQQTADAIYAAFGVRAAVPKQHDSEGLLALKSLMDVAQSNIVLVKGQGGRPDIAQTLKQRDAFLNNLVVYQREVIEQANINWTDHWQSLQVDGIVITSNAAVDAIFNGITEQQRGWLQQCRFYVASERIGAYLQLQQITSANIHTASGASDNAMFACIESQGSTMGKQTNDSSVNTPSDLNATKTALPTAGSKTDKQHQKSEPPKAKTMADNKKQKISKIASLALFISLIVASGVGYDFYQKRQSDKAQSFVFNEQNKKLIQEIQALKVTQGDLQRALLASEQKVTAALAQSAEENQQALKSALQQAQQLGTALNPQEVNRLHRTAEFKLLAEKDYQGASAALKRLDNLLNEHPGTVTLRQAISQDIQMLESLPIVPVEAIYLQLSSLLSQIDTLVFNAVSLPEEVVSKDDTQLSENISDWQQNISNSWQKILDSFLTVRHHEGEVIAPLITEQQRHLINQRIKLYLTQAQDALLTQQASVYFNAISESQRLVDENFKQGDSATKMVVKSLNTLSQEPLHFNPKVELQSTAQIKEWLQ
jgi:uroporphyrin-3 C-methyltransferase/uroporphyrinogen III methyltransferase/synthase